MKHLLIISIFFSIFLFGQEKTIIGTWNTIKVSSDIFQMNERKELSLTKKGKIIHNSKDGILNLKLGYSENQFIFTENNDVFVKMTKKSNHYIFKGKYDIDKETKTINLTLQNSVGTKLEKYFKYDFENEYLKLDVYFGGEPMKYLLRRE